MEGHSRNGAEAMMFISLNSGSGQAEMVRANEIVRIVPRYAPWLAGGFMAGSTIHLRNGDRFKVVESPDNVLRKIQELNAGGSSSAASSVTRNSGVGRS